MTEKCQHLKPCNAMAKMRKTHPDWSADVNWKYCETCPLRTGQSTASAAPKRPQNFLGKTIHKG